MMSPILRTLVPRLRAVLPPHQICRQWPVRSMSYEAPPPNPLELKMIALETEVKQMRRNAVVLGTGLAAAMVYTYVIFTIQFERKAP